MVHDLNAAGEPQRVAADVCVIGSGPAGLTLTRALLAKGFSVAMLEAGPERAAVAASTSEVKFGRQEYRGATLGRAFGLGGTSTIWGGQLLPLRREEMQARACVGALPWPIEYGEIAKYYGSVQGWVGIDPGPFELAADDAARTPLARLDWQGLKPRYSKWISFRRRNLAKSWLPAMLSTRRLQLWVNAPVWQWVTDGQAGVRKVVARSPSGRSLEIEAAIVVICAGALESARLVLELSEQGGTFRSDPTLAGRFLQDHLSIPIGTVRVLDRKRFAELFAPLFRGSTMCSPRLDLAPEAALGAGLPAAYAHFTARVSDESAFAALRDTLRNLQKGNVAVALKRGLALVRALPELAEIAYWRVARRRLIFPANAAMIVQLDFEQPQCFDNALRLSDERDASGRRGVVIDWHPSCDARRLVAHMTAQLRAVWARNRLDEIARLEFVAAPAENDAWLDKLYDIHHPAGTTRMARDASGGVVDADLQLFHVPNCYVASTSVFPSIGAANPTLTLMALALRLADHIEGRIRVQTCRSGTVDLSR